MACICVLVAAAWHQSLCRWPTALFDVPGQFEWAHEVTAPSLTAAEFYDLIQDYEGMRPVKFSRMAIDMPAFTRWQSDDALRNHAGEAMLAVEREKKETRASFLPADNENKEQMTLRDFVAMYRTAPLYAVSHIPAELLPDVQFPPFFDCSPAYLYTTRAHIWWGFASSASPISSVLHTDSVDNVHCVLSGSKKWVMTAADAEMTTGSCGWQTVGDYSTADPHAVDLDRFPCLADPERRWVKAVLQPGDCLFVPVEWAHQVETIGRTISFSINLMEHHRFHGAIMSRLEGCCGSERPAVPLSVCNFTARYGRATMCDGARVPPFSQEERNQFGSIGAEFFAALIQRETSVWHGLAGDSSNECTRSADSTVL